MEGERGEEFLLFAFYSCLEFLRFSVPLCLCGFLLSFTVAYAQDSQNPSHNLELVGALELSPVNADVWAHDNFAYVGTWAGGGCPGTGVKVVDISDPARPRLVSTLAAHANTSAEDIVVRRVNTPFFQGDLLAVGLQICNTNSPGLRGLELYDVTAPAAPQLLSFFDTTNESRGVHELDLLVRGGRVFALLATQARFRLVEVTDPRNPRQVSDWHLTEKLGEPLTGDPPLNSKFVHSALASPDGTLAFLSYWDAGVMILDITDPAAPRYLGRTAFGPGEEGNAHSVSASPDNRLLLQADEDCSAGRAPPFNDFGFLRIFDISNPRQPQQVAIFHSPHSRVDPLLGPAAAGAFCIHNPFLVGEMAFLSWYTDGIRAVDLANPRRPREVGWFLGQGDIWGVYVQPEKESLVLASDESFGLYVLRPSRPEPAAGGLVDAASFAITQGSSLRGAPVAPGAIVSLFGSKLAGATAQAEELPLPQRLAGTAVTVNGERASLFYVSPGQINFLVPERIPPGTARVRVENAGRLSAEISIEVVAAAPGIFTQSGDGRGLAAALRASDQSLVTAARPARAGEVVEIFLSGLNGAAPSVTLAGRAAEVLFAGPAPGFAGLWQINLRVPSGLQGNIELRVTAAGVASNTVLLPTG